MDLISAHSARTARARSPCSVPAAGSGDRFSLTWGHHAPGDRKSDGTRAAEPSDWLTGHVMEAIAAPCMGTEALCVWLEHRVQHGRVLHVNTRASIVRAFPHVHTPGACFNKEVQPTLS